MRGRSSANSVDGYLPESRSSVASNALRGKVANGALRRTVSNQASTLRGSSAQAATVCWASTSRGLAGTRIVSICPPSMRCTLTAQPIRSVRCLGNSTPWLISPTWCPARPMRCSPLATDGGVSTWITRSTAPMSIPSSRLEVATTAFNRPLLRASSTSARASLLTEPWCARASSGSAPKLCPLPIRCAGAPTATPGLGPPNSMPRRSAWISLSRAVRRSANRRELVKTIELLCASIRSTMRSSTSGQIELFSRFAMSGTGTCTVRSKVLAAGGATIVVGAAPERNRATSSGGRTVAERPMRCAGRSSIASSRSRDTARCAPRLVAATACTSSTITVCTPASVSRAAEVSIRNSDSGVVIRMSGGLVMSSRRFAGVVSPERTPTLIFGGS